MIINCSELLRVASFDTRCFDREGYLFVKEKHDGIFHHWKSECFVERLCRLKGNLLFIIATKTLTDADSALSDASLSDRIVCILILEEFTIKSFDESNKHYGFIIEFLKSDSGIPFHFATISHHERDSWIQAIHLSSFNYLKCLHKTLTKALNVSPDNTNDIGYNVTRNDVSLLLSITCDNLFIGDSQLKPTLTVYVYFRTLLKSWNLLGTTEAITARCPHFVKSLILPSTIHLKSHIELLLRVFQIIEPLTQTKCVLAECSLKIENLSQIDERCYKLELKSIVNDQIIGILSVNFHHYFQKSFSQIRRFKSLNSIVEHNDVINNKIIKSNVIENRRNRSQTVPNIKFFKITNPETIMSDLMENIDSKLFSNHIHKSFQFSFHNRFAFIDEVMAESALSFAFPQIIMNIFMDDEKMLMNCVTYSLGEVQTEWQRPQMKVLESHLRLVNILTESLNELSQTQLQMNFRPSTFKTELYLQFVPINFHLQRCLVTCPNDSNKKILQDIFTVGAYACHMLGFDNGGMKSDNDMLNSQNSCVSLNKVWKSMRTFLRISFLQRQIDNLMKQILHTFDTDSFDSCVCLELVNSADKLCKEIVTILDSKSVDDALAFSETIRGNINAYVNGNVSSSMERTLSLNETRDKSVNNSIENKELKRHRSLTLDESREEFEPLDLTYLNIRASIISLMSKLNNKYAKLTKNDLEPSNRKLKHAIEALKRSSSISYATETIKLQREQLEQFYLMRMRRDMLLSEALTSVVIATMSKLTDISFIERTLKSKVIFCQYEALLSCHGEEIGMLEDMSYIIDEINHCVTFVFERCSQNDSLPKIEGNSFNIKVTFPVIKLPIPLKSFECAITGVLFNIGINEQATLAEKYVQITLNDNAKDNDSYSFGNVKLQENINKKSYLILESYIERVFNDDAIVLNDLSALRVEIESKHAKNVRILNLSEQITHRIGGLRFTSCKSAKDRTSMAVTLEETRIFSKLFGVNEINAPQLFQNVLDTLRTEGTRRENTRKNVGIAKYAFNSLQLMTFPKLYRAPSGTYSLLET